ncbi:MAG: hypothetical protein NTU80_02935 [Verrucomicrobia bacterium]|nr:hypothetical protein [Verrucomicrobiota bacterium]
MIATDRCVTIVPYFQINEGKTSEFKALCKLLMDRVMHESNCLFYGFTFSGNEAHCREGYADAEGLIYHCKNVADLFSEIQKISTVTRLELHGPESELKKLELPLAELNPKNFVLELGFRR